MTNVTIIRTLRAAASELPASETRAKVEALAAKLAEANKRKTDYAARGALAWETRQRNARKAKRAA